MLTALYFTFFYEYFSNFFPFLFLIFFLRWSALTAYDIITEYKTEYLRLVEAFREGLPLEECIAAIEGEGNAVLTNQ